MRTRFCLDSGKNSINALIMEVFRSGRRTRYQSIPPVVSIDDKVPAVVDMLLRGAGKNNLMTKATIGGRHF